MTQGPQPVVEISESIASLTATLYQRSGAATLGLPQERFCAVLEEVAAKYLPEGASTYDRHELYSSLKVEDLALAHACAAGSERAWEMFIQRFRESSTTLLVTLPRKALPQKIWQTAFTLISTGQQRETVSAFAN